MQFNEGKFDFGQISAWVHSLYKVYVTILRQKVCFFFVHLRRNSVRKKCVLLKQALAKRRLTTLSGLWKSVEEKWNNNFGTTLPILKKKFHYPGNLQYDSPQRELPHKIC